MSESKGLGSKLLGIFVETDEERTSDDRASRERDEDAAPEAGGKSPAEIVAELAGQTAQVAGSGAAAKGPSLRLDTMQPAAPGAATDFEAIFRDAGMDASELDRVKKAEELLKTLPEGTPHDVKKQIVEASLKAFGFEISKIVAAAQNQKRALDAYVKVNENATARSIQDAEMQIRTLNEKIAALKADIEKRTQALAALAAQAKDRKAQVQQVIDFFQPPVSAGPT